MHFGRIHRLSDADYRRWQVLVKEAQRKRIRIERPEVAGEPFRLLRYGMEILATDDMRELERELTSL